MPWSEFAKAIERERVRQENEAKYQIWREKFLRSIQVIAGDLFATVKGHKFGSWITDGGRSVGYAATDVIDQPAYIIESILRDVLGITATNINTTSIDDIGNTTTGRRHRWKHRRSINEQANSLDVIEEFVRELGCLYLHDSANKARLVAIDYYNPTTQLTNADIVEDETGHPMARVGQTPIAAIKNEFFLNYRFEYGSNTFRKQKFITATGHNLTSNDRNDKSPRDTYTGLCSNSQSIYGKVDRWTVNSRLIYEDITAEYFIKLIADLLAIRRWRITSLLWQSARTLALEYGDQATWVLSLLPATMQDQVVTGVAAASEIRIGGTLVPGTTYYYVVTAIDKHGETRESSEVNATVAGGHNAVQISWAELSGAVSYRIYGRVSGGQNYYWGSAASPYHDEGAGGTLGSPPKAAPAFFVRRQRIQNGAGGGMKMEMEFISCPQIFEKIGGGYGYSYGEDYGIGF